VTASIEPYFADEHVQLYHGDMREVLPELDVRADACITDPPYGETSLAWDRWPTGWPALVAEYTNSLWCFGSMRMFFTQLSDFTYGGWKLAQDVVWRKDGGTGFQNDRFRRVHEYVTHWYLGAWSSVHQDVPRVPSGMPNKGSHRQGRGVGDHLGRVNNDGVWTDDGTRLMTSVFDAKRVRGGHHPTQKPQEVLDPLIRYSVPSGGLVLDPFAGSASTLLAARTLGRRAIGIEASEEYCERAAKRLSEQDLFTGSAS
jgi:site-specific DNA-methyltransferase (adenine-specific)